VNHKMLDENICKSVSIIIPVYNAEKTIEHCLRSVLKLNYPKSRLEIIVVDDGSVDRTLEIIKNFSDEVKIIRKKRGGAASAQNIGIKNSLGEIILNIDSDAYITKDFLNTAIKEFDDPQVGIVGGFLKPAPTKSFWAKMSGYESEERAFRRVSSKYVHHMTTTCTAYRRKMFEETGYFDEFFKQGGYDTEFSKRAIKAGWKIVLVDAICFHEWRSSFTSYFKQQIQGGIAMTKVLRKHPDAIKGDEVIRTKFFSLAFLLTVSIFLWPLFLVIFYPSYLSLFWIPYGILVFCHIPQAIRILRIHQNPQMVLFPFVIVLKYIAWLIGCVIAVIDILKKREKS